MSVETIKMSSKGQIVIPRDLRGELQAGEGTLFAVIGSKDTLILKKLETPTKENLIKELETLAKKGKKRLEAKGIKETDIPNLVEKARKK